MAVPELEKLAENERAEFVRLYHTAPDEWTDQETVKWDDLMSRIDVERYRFEVLREEAKTPQELVCEVTGRSPYIVQTRYGELAIPDELVPQEIKAPLADVYDDIVFADVSADLDKMAVTYFRFNRFLEKGSDEELDNVEGIDSAPEGSWPRRKD
ncbi:MAG: hypothetical protein AABX27_00425 [Nanoarchaeota archaeon]